jgi:exoribonuclease R
MVLANVAAAETLIAKRTPLLFRVHEEPQPEKLDALREVARGRGLHAGQGAGAADRASQPAAAPGRRHRASPN